MLSLFIFMFSFISNYLSCLFVVVVVSCEKDDDITVSGGDGGSDCAGFIAVVKVEQYFFRENPFLQLFVGCSCVVVVIE